MQNAWMGSGWMMRSGAFYTGELGQDSGTLSPAAGAGLRKHVTGDLVTCTTV